MPTNMTLEKLRELKDNFSDEIPNRILSSHDLDEKQSKVRKNWWQGVTSALENSLDEEGIIPEGLRPDVEEFIRHYTSEKFKDQPLTTRNDIVRVNDLLNEVLNRRQD